MRTLTWGLAAAAAVGAGLWFGPGVAAADDESPGRSTAAAADPGPRAAAKGTRGRTAASATAAQTWAASATAAPVRAASATAARTWAASATAAPARRGAAVSVPRVSVRLPQVPIRDGWSFTVSDEAISATAQRYVADGGDPADAPRFFFGDLAVRSLDTLAGATVSREQVRVELGNLATSGYFGGVWLRDNLREPAPGGEVSTATTDLTVSALGIRLFDALAMGLTAAADAHPVIATTAAHLSVPALLALYGYNRGYLEVLLDNPPPGVTSRRDTLSCRGFLACNSSAFPLEIATRYDDALDNLARPGTLGWVEMAAWSAVLETATGAGKLVWNAIAAGGFSPASYAALVDLSSAYLMVSKAAVLSSMQATAEGDAALARSALLLQAGLWMWSGAYFGGLASSAPRGTIPALTVTA